MEDLYRVLQLQSTASCTEVKKSYQELALKYHPDKTNNHTSKTPPADMFIKVNRAYRILSDPDLRRQYDVKWRERCLAQAYPIQDVVDFEDFEEAEIQSTDAGENDAHSELLTVEETYGITVCNRDEMQKFKGDNYVVSSVIRNKKDNSNNIDSVEHCSKGGNSNDCEISGFEEVTCTNVNSSSDFRTEDFKTTTGITRINKDISSESTNRMADSYVDKSDCKTMEELSSEHEIAQEKWSKPKVTHEVVYTYDCRCGGNYILTEVDVRLKFDFVCCDSCSLTVKVNYADDDDDHSCI